MLSDLILLTDLYIHQQMLKYLSSSFTHLIIAMVIFI